MRSNQKKPSDSTRSVASEGKSSFTISSGVLTLRLGPVFQDRVEPPPLDELPFRQVMESIGQVIWISNLERTRTFYLSPGYERIWGRSCRSVYESPQSWLESVHPDDRARIAEASCAIELQDNRDLEYRIVRGDRMVRWIRDRAFLIRDSAGVPYCLARIAEDITAGKESERALRESEQHYRQLIELCPDALYIRHDFNFTFVNSAALRLFGVDKPEDLIGKSLLDFIPKSYARMFSGRIHHPLSPGVVSGMTQGKVLRADGSQRYVEVVSVPIETSTGPAILSAMRDVTDRKELECEILHAVEREQERIGQDLHDGLCQLLVATKYRVAMLERMLMRDAHHHEAFGIEHMLNEAISHARGLARGLNPVKLSGNGLAHALEELAAITQASKTVRCTFHCPAPLAPLSHAVANHLYRIAQESVQNAMKHGNAKKIAITLRKGDSRLMLTIKDDGSGLPERATDGAGIDNMKTRAAMLGATLKISRPPGGGTAVVCALNPSHTRNHADRA
jgi:PAS domain S-box-containing protein